MNVTVVACKTHHESPLRALLQKAVPGLNVATLTGDVSRVTTEIAGSGSGLVLAEVGKLTRVQRESLAAAIQLAPSRPIVLVSTDSSAEFLLWAMRSGVAEVVPSPVNPAELGAAVSRQVRRFESAQATATVTDHPAVGRSSGNVVAFLPAKGGSGATFLASNAAAALAARGSRVALIDLNLTLGDAALFVTEDAPVRSIADVCQDASRIDADLVEGSMTEVLENLFVLAAPESPEAGLEIDPQAIERLIEVARERFDFIIIDAGRVLDARILRGLDAADSICMVMQLALPNVHDAKRLRTMFEGLGYHRNKLRVIVNRYERGTDIGVSDVEKALGCEVTLKVPNDFKTVTYAINHAIPVFQYKKRGPVTDAVLELADRIAGVERPASAFKRAFGLGLPLSLIPSKG